MHIAPDDRGILACLCAVLVAVDHAACVIKIVGGGVPNGEIHLMNIGCKGVLAGSGNDFKKHGEILCG